ncbi:hypothetical protein C1H46_001464 [Malus baccata]|uniref:Uncharacterized protein n=1 Tax=Malus baccata TaxID=106549 RepID=A0A540NP45_MALBA|nr:hypothetical protein C1H46_001464 [Malus baccata]
MENQRTNTCMGFLCESSRIHIKKDAPTPNNVRSMADRPNSYSFDAEVFASQILFQILKKKIMEKTELD